MGYSNHHAGLHMVHYNTYGRYDDLKYYDKLAEEKRNAEKDAFERKKKLQEQKNSTKQKKSESEPLMMQPTYGKHKIMEDRFFEDCEFRTNNIYKMDYRKRMTNERKLSFMKLNY